MFFILTERTLHRYRVSQLPTNGSVRPILSARECIEGGENGEEWKASRGSVLVLHNGEVTQINGIETILGWRRMEENC